MKSKNPFYPESRGNIAVIDGRASGESELRLKNLGFKVIRTVKCRSTYDSVSYHPDIVMHPVNHRDIVIAPDMYNHYKESLGNYGFNLIKGDKEISLNYPGNIGYNVGRVGNLAIHNIKYTDSKLKQCLDGESVEWVDVKQGYSKCSILTLGENRVMTSDAGIAKALEEKQGLEVCLIETGDIKLEGFDYGFIGGTGGMISPRDLVLSGHYQNHRSVKTMDRIFQDNGIRVHMISDKCIEDLGSIIFLNSSKAEKG